MRRRIGCIIFVLVGLAWLAFVSIELLGSIMGDCASPDDKCSFYRGYVSGYVFWRGLAVALLLLIAYAFWRRLIEDDDVH